MFTIFSRYIFKYIITSIVIVTFILTSISSIIKFIYELNKVGQDNYSFISAGLYTLFSIPKDIEMLFPIATLLGSLIGLSILTINNELLVIRSSGFSIFQLIKSIILTALPLVLILIIINECLSPFCEQLANNYRTYILNNNSTISTKDGLWIKDDNNFICIKYITNNIKLFDINIYLIDKKYQLQKVLHAKSAIFIDNNWVLFQIEELNFDKNQQLSHKYYDNYVWKTNLTPNKISILLLDINAFSISKLINYINYLEQNGQDAYYYKIAMWNKILSPLSIIIMLLISLSCVLGPLNNKPIWLQITFGIIFGFLFYILNNFFNILSLIFRISPILGASIPSLVFFIFSIFIFMKYC